MRPTRADLRPPLGRASTHPRGTGWPSRYRLDRGSRRFEGFGMALVGTTPNSEAILEAENPADFGIQGDAAPEPGAKAAKRHDDVVLVLDLVDTRLELLEGRVQVGPPPLDALVAVVRDVAFDLRREGVPLDVGVRGLQQGLDVVPEEGLHTLAEDLH